MWFLTCADRSTLLEECGFTGKPYTSRYLTRVRARAGPRCLGLLHCRCRKARICNDPGFRIYLQAAAHIQSRGLTSRISCLCSMPSCPDRCMSGHARQSIPEANDLLPISAPVLELLWRDKLCHLQVLGSWLKVLPKRQDVHPYRHSTASAPAWLAMTFANLALLKVSCHVAASLHGQTHDNQVLSKKMLLYHGTS